MKINLSKIIYKNKRDHNGLLLRYSGDEFTLEIIKKFHKLAINSDVYEILINSIPKNYLDIFIKKCFLYDIRKNCHIANFILKNQKDFVNEDKYDLIVFDNNLKEILSLYLQQYNFNLLYKKKINLKKLIKPFYLYSKKKYNYFFSKFFKNKKVSKYKIACSYTEGFDKSKKSDFFWFNNSKINPSDVIVYFEYKEMIYKHDILFKGEGLNEIKKYGFNIIKLWNWYGLKEVPVINSLKKKLKRSKKNFINNYLIEKFNFFFDRIEYWHTFFNDHDIKIDLTPEEYSIYGIAKQVAIYLLNGCSVGKIRSYPGYKKNNLIGLYTQDIVFAWGNDSAKRLLSTEDCPNNVLISGYYINTNKNNFAELLNNKIKKIFKKNNIKFTVLLLDSNYSNNDTKDFKNGEFQLIYKDELIKYYTKVINFIKKNKNFGLIIKPKKLKNLQDLGNVKDMIDEVCKEGRCFLVKNSSQILATNLSKISDIAITIGTFFPTVLMECVISGSKGVHFDYSNLKSIEKEIYNWGNDKVFFTSIDVLLEKVREYALAKNDNIDIGNWDKQLNEIDSFRDGNGGSRIGEYLKILLDNLKKFDRETSIVNSNNYYATVWGKDKIFKNK